MAITLSVDFSGSPEESDINAAKLIIDRENERRAALETPLPALPYSTNQELKASYLTSLAAIVQKAHDSYVEQAKKAALTALKDGILGASDSQIAQIKTILGL